MAPNARVMTKALHAEQVDDRCEDTCAGRPMRAAMHPFSIEYKKTENEQKRSVKTYDSFRDELLKRQLSNNENHDKPIVPMSA